MQNYDQPEIINVGSGVDLSIRDLALIVKKYVGFEGEIFFNANKPDGTLRKLMDTSKINNLGWFPKISLEEGIKRVCQDYEMERNRQFSGALR
jgi:GDP-L-fucose synthase